MSYKKLTIWQEARQIVQDIHKMTLNKLPKFELYEGGSQIRRSIKSVKSNIAGFAPYGLRFMFDVFAIESLTAKRIYIGITIDKEKRLKYHDSG